MQLRIQSAGMISSLGHLVPACAAYRAGIVKPSTARDFSYFESGDEESTPAQVFEVPVITSGFAGVGRLVIITAAVLQDLISDSGDMIVRSQPHFFVALPDPWARGIFRVDVEAETENDRVTKLGKIVFAKLAALFGFGAENSTHFFTGEHAAYAKALAAAHEALTVRRCESAIVLAADSLVEPTTLQSLFDQHRMKTGNNALGFLPGEAGAALWLSAPSYRSNRPEKGSKNIFVDGRVVFGNEFNSVASNTPVTGEATANCIRSALVNQGLNTSEVVLIGDHNGEAHRADEWGKVQMRLRGSELRNVGFKSWFPVESFGEIGVAYGAIASCIALRSLERGYSPSDLLIVTCADENNDRCAFSIFKSVG